MSATPGVDGTTATITWTTDELANGRVDYGTDPESLTLVVTDGVLSTSHSLPLSGLTASTTYYYRVTSEDAATNSATSPAEPAAPLSFVTAAPDTTAPVISSVSAVPGVNGSATITWSTDELSTSRVDYGTASDALTLNVSAAGLVTSHSLALTGLSPDTTYYYRVTSVDASTNSATSPASPAPAATFTTPSASFVDTTVSDFSAGILNSCVADSTIGDGALHLPLAIDEPFSGPSLPAGWTSYNWTGSDPTISGGSLTVNGSEAYTTAQFGPGRTLEFSATFGAQPYQHIGFGGTLAADNGNYVPFAGPPWIMFSTSNDGLHLYARVLPAGATGFNSGNDKILIGDYLGAQHTYRIDWKANSIDFYVDGSLITTITATIADSMSVSISDLQSAAPSVSVDWLRLTPYASPCSFVSQVFDAGAPANWGTLSWTGTTPAGTSLALSYRIGNTLIPDGTWTAYVPVATSGAALSGNSRYIRYRAVLTNSDPAQTPVLNDVAITYALGNETTPPTITDRSPAPGATDINVTGNVDVTFSELMDVATITGSSLRLRKVGDVSDVPAAVTLTGNIATLDPSADLSPLTTYQVTVAASVADLAGNTLGADDTWTFTTGAVIATVTDTTVADFNAGSTLACVVDASVGDGAIRLPLTLDENFSGTTLPNGWSSAAWGAGGTATASAIR